MWYEYVDMILYFGISFLIVYRMSNCDSLFAISLPQFFKNFLLIRSRGDRKTSVLVVVFQLYTYMMTLIFICSRFIAFDFLYRFFENPNAVYSLYFKIQFLILLPLMFVEVGACALINYFKTR